MTLFRMVKSRVDPFAVYEAERELAARGIRVPRERLVAHYVAQGQLRTLVAKLTASATPTRMDEAFAAALAEGPDESANPRYVAPLRMGLILGGTVMLGVLVAGAARMRRLGPGSNQIRLDLVLISAGILFAICMAYAYLGARIGRVKANKVACLIVALAFLGFLYWFSQYLESRHSSP